MKSWIKDEVILHVVDARISVYRCTGRTAAPWEQCSVRSPTRAFLWTTRAQPSPWEKSGRSAAAETQSTASPNKTAYTERRALLFLGRPIMLMGSLCSWAKQPLLLMSELAFIRYVHTKVVCVCLMRIFYVLSMYDGPINSMKTICRCPTPTCCQSLRATS